MTLCLVTIYFRLTLCSSERSARNNSRENIINIFLREAAKYVRQRALRPGLLQRGAYLQNFHRGRLRRQRTAPLPDKRGAVSLQRRGECLERLQSHGRKGSVHLGQVLLYSAAGSALYRWAETPLRSTGSFARKEDISHRTIQRKLSCVGCFELFGRGATCHEKAEIARTGNPLRA